MRAILRASALAVLVVTGCFVSVGNQPIEACEAELCGCVTQEPFTFTGFVADGETGACVPFKLVRLRNLDGTVLAEDRSRTFGSYTVSAPNVDRYSKDCPGGEPVIRDDPEPGQPLPTYTYLPRRSPVDQSSERVDLFRFPYGTQDAGPDLPTSCTPPQGDGGM